MNSARDRRPPPWIGAAGGALVLLGAIVAAWIGIITKALICESECRTTLMTVQMAVGIAGLVPAGATCVLAVRQRWLLASLSLAVTLFVYLGWAVLNDAAVHGWDHLKVF